MGSRVRITGEVSRAASGPFMVGERGSLSGIWVGDFDEGRFINSEEVIVYGVVTDGGDFADIEIMLEVVEFAD